MRTAESIILGVCLTGFLALSAPANQSEGRYPHAVRLLNSGVYFEAAAILEEFLLTHPDHEAGKLHLARALYHLKRNRESSLQAAEVLRLNPENREAKRLLTQLRIALGRELDTQNLDAVVSYARLCMHTDSYGRAAAFFERYLLKRPEDQQARLELAEMLHWSARYERSAFHYQIYLEEETEDLDARSDYAKVLNAAGHFSQAVIQLEHCLQATPGDRKLQFALARACWWSDQIDGRKPLFLQVVETEATTIEDLNFQVSVARKLNWPDVEYRLYEKILALDPAHRKAAEGKNTFDETHTIETLRLRKLVAGDPENPDTRRNLIKHFIDHEKLAEAMNELKYLPRHDSVRVELGAEVEKLRRQVGKRTVAMLNSMKKEVRGNEESAIAASRDWLENHPDDQRTRGLLAYRLSAENQGMEAAQEYRIILRSFPTVNPTIVARVKLLESSAKKETQP